MFMLLYLSVAARIATSKQSTVRDTVYGKVEGTVFHSEGVTGEIFHGIPFAQPPVGELRFKRPAKPYRWGGVRKASQRRGDCTQFWYWEENSSRGQDGSEDCLYLSVYLPHVARSRGSAKLYPVLFWIHGGSYTVGGSSAFPDRSVLKNLVSFGSVVVIPNYRLGPLGFLSMLNESCAGNFGLSDQIAALDWVHENIHFFGGDRNMITVAGESAGASSAGLLAVSPLSRHLFSRLMLRSGSTFAPWAVRSRNTDFNSMSLMNAVGCQRENITATMDCMRNATTQELIGAWTGLAMDDRNMMMDPMHVPQHYNHPLMAHTYFTPVVDRFMGTDSIVPGYVDKMIAEHGRKAIMLGTVTAECTGYGMLMAASARKSGRSRLRMELLTPSILYRNIAQVQQATAKRYLKPGLRFNASLAIEETVQIWQSVVSACVEGIEIASDQSFVSPMLREAEAYAQNGADVFVYAFNHTVDSVRQRYASYGLVNFTSSPHGSDLLYIFESSKMIDGNVWPMTFGRQDQNVADVLSQQIVNFVKTGHPSSDTKWPRFDGTNYNTIQVYTDDRSDIAGIRKNVRETNMFWNQVVPALDEAMFRENVLHQPQPGDETSDPGAVDYKYPFFIAVACCAVFFCATCGLIFVHFSRTKMAFPV